MKTPDTKELAEQLADESQENEYHDTFQEEQDPRSSIENRLSLLQRILKTEAPPGMSYILLFG